MKSLENTRQRILEFKKRIGQTSAERPKGVSMEGEVRILNDRLDLAFGLAAVAGEAEARAQGAPIAAASSTCSRTTSRSSRRRGSGG